MALDHLPERHVLLRGLAALNLAWAYHAGGDLAASQQSMQAAALSGHSPDQALIAVTAECYRADLCRREGQLRQAQALYQHALELATDARGARLPIASRALVGLGELAREWNDLDQATQYTLEGIGLAGRWVQVGVFEAYLTLARIRQAQADRGGIREALQMLRQVTIAFKATAVLARWVGLVEAWMQIAQGDLDEPRHWARRAGLSGENDSHDPLALEQRDDINLRRLHKYEVPVAARLWLAAGRPAEALALLAPALMHVEQINRTGQVIEYELLIALATAALGQPSKAMQSLERALTLAAPEGFVRIFVDEGQPMARLLREAASQRIQPAYVGRLLAAFGEESTTNTLIPDPRFLNALVEPLSEREGEVLRLIAEGLSNDAIARRLVLALPTIKWHTSNIYGKLSVKNRTEAVAKARSLGLLPLT
jgi:LuxR family transcriptional regulator, maltose regulon positive regulatory protein